MESSSIAAGTRGSREDDDIDHQIEDSRGRSSIQPHKVPVPRFLNPFDRRTSDNDVQRRHFDTSTGQAVTKEIRNSRPREKQSKHSQRGSRQRGLPARMSRAPETLSPMLDTKVALAHRNFSSGAGELIDIIQEPNTQFYKVIDQNYIPRQSSGEGKPQRIFESMTSVPEVSNTVYKDGYHDSNLVMLHRQQYGNLKQTAEYECVVQSPPRRLQQQTSSELKYQRVESSAINRLNQEIEDQRKIYQKQIEGLQRVIDQGDSSYIPQKTDGEIAGLIGSIREEIQTFARQAAKAFRTPLVLGQSFRLSKITAEMEHEIKMVMPIPNISIAEAFASMKGVRHRRYFVQGWIHLSLWKFVFRSNLLTEDVDMSLGSNPKDQWLSGELGDAVEKLESEFASLAKAKKLGPTSFHKWRALTLSILYSINPPSDNIREGCHQTIEKRCQDMAEVLEELRSCGKAGPDHLNICEDDNTKALKEGLVNIFGRALKLSSLLRTQKAAFGMRFPTAPRSQLPIPLYLNTTWMEVDGDPDDGVNLQSIVNYVIEPAWFKCGNANGEKYEQEPGCFIKAKVGCLPVLTEDSKDQMTQHRPSPRNKLEQDLAF